MRRLSSSGVFTSGVSVVLLIFAVVFQLEQAIGATPVAKKSCIVKNINVQKGFNLGRFLGHWHDFARVHLATDAVVLSSGVSEYSVLPNGDLQIKYGGEKNGRCIQPLVATGRQNGTNSAKLTVDFDDVPDAFLRGAFWVVETNYEHAIIYSCYKTNEDGTCHSDNELAYVISRNQTLRPAIVKRIQWIVRNRLCIEVNRLKHTDYKFPCPPDPEYDLQKYLDRIINENANETEGLEDF